MMRLADVTRRAAVDIGAPARIFLGVVVGSLASTSGRAADPRSIRNGREIPSVRYADQPYVVVLPDGSWLCTLTTGSGAEGSGGQHVISTISTDEGRTWSEPVAIEPPTGPEASWVVPLVCPDAGPARGAGPGGRVYAFYTYNGDEVRTLPGKRRNIRSDTHGWYVFKHSDDGGRTWSGERHRIPLRVTDCDRSNDWRGEVQMFWGIDKPKASGGVVNFAFTKLGRYFLKNGEGWLLRSGNILTERDPAKVRFELLPEGERGIRAPGFGSVQEEHNTVPMSGGGLYCVYRTTTGHPCHTYSRDGGRTWLEPEHMTYSPGGRKVKQPRACPKLFRCSNGAFLFWYHNHGGRDFNDRNPAWIAGGVEKGGRIHWSEPEVLLYDPDPKVRMSYPDLIEQGGRYWITETQKEVARVHEIDAALLEGMWNQGGPSKVAEVAKDGLVLRLGGREAEKPLAKSVRMTVLPDLSGSGGFAVDMWLVLDDLAGGQVVLDSRKGDGSGLRVETTAEGALRIDIADGERSGGWDTDPGAVTAGRLHHVVFIVDGGPKIVTVVADGVLLDGGAHRQYGWGRFDAKLGDVTGSPELRVAPSMRGEVRSLRIYDRYLRTSEAVANFRAGGVTPPR
ncbi:MAG: LamG-like jellyroll fold domain-containing protein [Planctomycetota bacterium]|jgi:hypothetical protein